jgi:hypothetical protein
MNSTALAKNDGKPMLNPLATPSNNRNSFCPGAPAPKEGNVKRRAIDQAIWDQVTKENMDLKGRVAELERDRRELRRVICTLSPRLQETECECSDDGFCDKHLVEVTLANYPKR